MSLIDYGQTAEDHQTLLFLVRHTGTKLSLKCFNRIWERIHKLNVVPIPGQKRRAWVNYKRTYPKENNEWGDIQAHRKTLGLVSVGECSNSDEFEELFDSYRKVKEEYASTLINSRLIVLGMNTDGSPLNDEQKESILSGRKLSPTHSEDSGVSADLSPSESHDEMTKAESSVVKNDSQDSSKKGKTEVPATKPENPGVIFIKPEKGKKENKEKDEGRRSHSNSLTKESTGSEVVFYPSLDDCADLEEKIKEFVASIFFVLEGKRLDRSFEKMDKMQLLCAPFEKKDYVGLDTDTKSFRKKCQGRLRKHLADLCLQAGLPGEAILHYQTAIDILKPVNDALWMGACYEGLCSASVVLIYPQIMAPQLRRNYSMSVSRGSNMTHEVMRGTGSMKNLSNGLSDMPETVIKTALNPDDIIEKYREALMQYSKLKGAGLIEIEASLKACRVLIAQRKYLQASDFLQNIMYINLQTAEEDKINRYCTLSDLYTQIGFKRKACFFRRIAAMQCVAPSNPNQNWHQCYKLLMQSLVGYKITLDPKDIPEGHVNGWPVLQSRVLNELIFSSRKMGNLAVAVRHTTYLLHMLYDHLSIQERREIASTLESLTARCEGTAQSLALDSGIILPPVPLIHIPFVKSFKLVRLQPHLEPVKMGAKKEAVDSGPFIWTPINMGQASPSETSTTVDFSWVAKDVCEVQLQLYNPMPDELKIQQMGLLTDGVEVEMYPTNLCIPAESVPNLVKILSRPQTAGKLNILGYFTHLLGVRSNCKLKDLVHLHQSKASINIIPSLPQIQLTCSLPKAVSFTTAGDGANVVTSGITSLYAGQSQECLVTIQNTSNQVVERVDVSIDCKQDDSDYLSQIFQWSCENIESQLPLHPSNMICFTVCIYGLSNFLPCDQGTSSPSHSVDNREDITEGKSIESLLRVEYSGGEGLKAGYCRRCAVALSVDILPSVIFKRWDVLPADSCDHCYLVFDLHNLSSHTMQIFYTADDYLVYEPNQIRRIAVKIERCIFPSISKSESTEDSYSQKSPPKYRQLCHYSSYLSKFVDIRWCISATKSNGKISIEHLNWTEEQLALISVSPVAWDIKINGQPYLVNTISDHSIGDLVELDVTLNIKGDMPEGDAVLVVDCFQDFNNAHRSCNIDDKVSCIGSNTLTIPKIRDQSSHSFSTSFLFHYSGLYKLTCNCVVKSTENQSQDQTWTSLSVQVKVDDSE